MARGPANGKGAASMRRAGSLADDADVVGTFDDPQTRAAAIAADKGRDRAYKQGQAAAKRSIQESGSTRGHEPARVHDDPELQSLYEQGHGDQLRDERRTRRQARARQAAKPIGTTITSSAHDSAGVVLGMIGYALFLAYIKGGWSGVTGWLGAKFLNKTATSSSSAPQGFPSGTTFDPSTGLLQIPGQPPLRAYAGPNGSVDFSPGQPVGPGGGLA